MRKLCGFVLFWIAVGMFIGLYLSAGFWIIVLLIVLMLVGYNLFCD